VSGRHAADDTTAVQEAEGPLLRVVGGSPSPEELAAVTAVLTALEAEAAETARAAPRDVSSSPSGWSSRTARLRRPVDRGPGRWRSFSA
jgi:uncharacterized protein (DUF1800 family)